LPGVKVPYPGFKTIIMNIWTRRSYKQGLITKSIRKDIQIGYSHSDYEIISFTRDAAGRVTSAGVKWLDGSSGTYKATNYNETHEVYDGYTVTHKNNSVTVTQPAVTRNADGAIITKPELIIT